MGRNLFAADDDVWLLARALRADRHLDRDRFLKTHETAESALHERFRSIKVHRPAHAEHTVAEEPVRFGVPVRLADPLPGRRPKVVGNDATDLALPRALGRRLDQFRGDRRGDQRKRGEPGKAADSAQTPHTSVKRSTRVTLHVLKSLLQAGEEGRRLQLTTRWVRWATPRPPIQHWPVPL